MFVRIIEQDVLGDAVEEVISGDVVEGRGEEDLILINLVVEDRGEDEDD